MPGTSDNFLEGIIKKDVFLSDVFNGKLNETRVAEKDQIFLDLESQVSQISDLLEKFDLAKISNVLLSLGIALTKSQGTLNENIANINKVATDMTNNINPISYQENKDNDAIKDKLLEKLETTKKEAKIFPELVRDNNGDD